MELKLQDVAIQTFYCESLLELKNVEKKRSFEILFDFLMRKQSIALFNYDNL